MVPRTTPDVDKAKKLLEDPKYKMLDDIIEEVNVSGVKINNEEQKILQDTFNTVITSFIEKMKSLDVQFKKIFNRITYTGSFYDGLRISEANEYDLNLILKPSLNMKLVKHGCPPGFIAIAVENDANMKENPYKDWLHFDSKSNKTFLHPDKVRSWLQKIVTKTENKIKEEDSLQPGCKIKIRQSGPAWTLVATLTEPLHKKIDIDLVPCLEFNSENWPKIPRKKNKLLKGSENSTWFAVPKSPKPSLNDSKNSFLIAWRLSFPIQESHIIRDLKYLKYTIRLMKKLRDEFKMHVIASYHIKTLFLWEIEKNDTNMWTVYSRGQLFIYMVTRFKEALKVKKIPFFWEPDCNLIKQAPKQYLEDSCNRLINFIKKIDGYIERNEQESLRKYIGNLLKI